MPPAATSATSSRRTAFPRMSRAPRGRTPGPRWPAGRRDHRRSRCSVPCTRTPWEGLCAAQLPAHRRTTTTADAPSTSPDSNRRRTLQLLQASCRGLAAHDDKSVELPQPPIEGAHRGRAATLPSKRPTTCRRSRAVARADAKSYDHQDRGRRRGRRRDLLVSVPLPRARPARSSGSRTATTVTRSPPAWVTALRTDPSTG